MSTEKWDAELYNRKHGFISGYGEGVIGVLEPKAGERILDLGCGTGHLAKMIAEAGARVIGIDSSPSMIESAKISYPELEFHVADATNFAFAEPFDAIFSNATLHWVIEAEKAVQAMAAALKTGGRVVVELGGKGNVAIIRGSVRQAIQELQGRDVEDGWYFPSVGEYTPLLERHGLMVYSVVLFDRPTPLEGEEGFKNWVTMFGMRMLQDIPSEIRPRVLERAEELARDRLYKDGQWLADYKRLRVVAYKI